MIRWIKKFKKRDGPHLIAKMEFDLEKALRHMDLVRNYQKIVIPDEKTVLELEEYIVNVHKGEKVEIDKGELRSFKINTLLAKVLKHPEFKEMDEGGYYDGGDLIAEAKNLIDNGFEFDCVAYKFENYRRGDRIPILKLERKHSHCSMSGGGYWTNGLWDDLTIFLSVSDVDIESASPRFLGYIYALENRNKDSN